MKTVKLLAPLALVLITQACKKSEGLEEGIFSGTYIGTRIYSSVNAEGIILEDTLYQDTVIVNYSDKNYLISGEIAEIISKEDLDDGTHSITKNEGDYRVNYSFFSDQLSIKISSKVSSGTTYRWDFSGEK